MITKDEKEKIETELKKGYASFYHFSLSLVESLDDKNGNLKFAVVNMQIALELFLKYYFVKNNLFEKVFIEKNGKRKFKDFSEVLNAYYTIVRKGHYADKKHLKVLLESRNDIVHKGQFNDWDEDLANYIISCAFFIQGVLRKEFSETLLSPKYHPHKLSENYIWKNNATAFAKKVCKDFNESPLECPHCYSRALIRKEIFDFDNCGSFEDYQCLACLCEVETEIYGAIIDCCACEKKAFYVDRLNIQKDNTHFGGCLNCGNKMDLRHCDNCDKFYFHELEESNFKIDNNYFCSQLCMEVFKEQKNNFG